MHDSGERQGFETGAVRDTASGKPQLELISPFALRRLGTWLGLGARKYTPRNWERGIPITRCLASLLRHAEAYLAGEADEDHMAAVMCNAMFIMHYEEMIRRGVLPKSIDDRPEYRVSTDETPGQTADTPRYAPTWEDLGLTTPSTQSDKETRRAYHVVVHRYGNVEKFHHATLDGAIGDAIALQESGECYVTGISCDVGRAGIDTMALWTAPALGGHGGDLEEFAERTLSRGRDEQPTIHTEGDPVVQEREGHGSAMGGDGEMRTGGLG